MPSFYLPEVDLVFLHNPKTAGRLIRHHVWGKDIKGPYQGYIPNEYRNKFKFCFVRNPYDRLVSSWKHCLEYIKDSSEIKEINLQAFFEIAVNNSHIDHWPRSIINKKNMQVQSFAFHHTMPQTDNFYMLNQADFIGKFENLQDDFDYLCSLRKIAKIRLPIIKEYQTKHSHYLEYFIDKNFTKKVTEYYETDFNTYGYEKIII